MDTKYLGKSSNMNNSYLLPDISKPYIKKDILQTEAYNSIRRNFPLAEDIEDLLPETHRKKKLAAEVSGMCWALAGDFVISQDESILDDYDWI